MENLFTGDEARDIGGLTDAIVWDMLDYSNALMTPREIQYWNDFLDRARVAWSSDDEQRAFEAACAFRDKVRSRSVHGFLPMRWS